MVKFHQLINLRVCVKYAIATASVVPARVAECDWWEELMGDIFIFFSLAVTATKEVLTRGPMLNGIECRRICAGSGNCG